MAKVFIVQWSENMIFVDGNRFFASTQKRQFSKYFGVPEMALPLTKIMF